MRPRLVVYFLYALLIWGKNFKLVFFQRFSERF
jgi:hypothetical protein